MKNELKTVCYDEELNMEAYHFQGIIRPFPNHFHDYYVIGLIESGKRKLCCKNKEYNLKSGDIFIFNPNDNHGCVQVSDEEFNYISFNIPKCTMRTLTEKIENKKYVHKDIEFSKNVVSDKEIASYICALYTLITGTAEKFEKEEILVFIINLLLRHCERQKININNNYENEIAEICNYIEINYNQNISLEKLCSIVSLSKSTLLRAFTKEKGITPYRYLQSVRIIKARKLLEEGISPIDAAIITGFSDQSHFTRFFSLFTGLSPTAYKKIFKEGENNAKT